MAISQKVKKEYLALVAELNKHNDLYHNQDSPEISDQEYDQLFKKLLIFESEFPDRYFKDCTDFMGISEKKALTVIDKFRPPHLWKKVGKKWHRLQEDYNK